MDKHMNHSWEPKLTSYPPLILDDHATEWAERITDRDHDDITAEGEAARCQGEVLPGQSDRVGDSRAADSYVADRVWWRDVSSGLCG
jgi:hypothetical protein